MVLPGHPAYCVWLWLLCLFACEFFSLGQTFAAVEAHYKEGAHGTDDGCDKQIGAQIPGLTAIGAHQHGCDHGGDTGRENARELVYQGHCGVAHCGLEAAGEEAGHGGVGSAVDDAEGQGDGQEDQKDVVGEVVHDPEGGEGRESQENGCAAEDAGAAKAVSLHAPEGNGKGHDKGCTHDDEDAGCLVHATGIGEVG